MGNKVLEILQGIFNAFASILDYVFNLRIADIPYFLFIIGISGGIGYCLSLIIIGFPCSIWEAITKKKISDEKQDKVIKIVAICLFTIILLLTLYDFSTKR